MASELFKRSAEGGKEVLSLSTSRFGRTGRKQAGVYKIVGRKTLSTTTNGGRNSSYIDIADIKSIDVEKPSAIAKTIGYGSLLFNSKDSGDEPTKWVNIREPENVREFIWSLRESLLSERKSSGSGEDEGGTLTKSKDAASAIPIPVREYGLFGLKHALRTMKKTMEHEWHLDSYVMSMDWFIQQWPTRDWVTRLERYLEMATDPRYLPDQQLRYLERLWLMASEACYTGEVEPGNPLFERAKAIVNKVLSKYEELGGEVDTSFTRNPRMHHWRMDDSSKQEAATELNEERSATSDVESDTGIYGDAEANAAMVKNHQRKLAEALQFFGYSSVPDRGSLKDRYREKMKSYHGDFHAEINEHYEVLLEATE